MNAVEQLRGYIAAVRLTVAEQQPDHLGRIFVVAEVLEREADRLDALASTLAHVDPDVLDLAAVVAADVAEAPLPDGWTAVAPGFGDVFLYGPEPGDRGIAAWRSARGDWQLRVRHGGHYAHLADVVAAVTGTPS